LPIFFVHGTSVLGSQTEMNPLIFLVDVTASSVLVTWIFNHTRGSLLIAYLYHAAVNTWTSEVFRSNSIEATVILVLAAVIVVLVFGPENLARKPLTRVTSAPDEPAPA
nr:hypothetical protein [Caldilineaceae bacterium]